MNIITSCLDQESVTGFSSAKILMTSSQGDFVLLLRLFYFFQIHPGFFHRIAAHFWCVSKRNVS